MPRLLGGALLALPGPFTVRADTTPIFDAHLHYSHDAAERVSPAEAIALIRKAGVTRAMVSSSDDDGTQKLVALAPDLIVPELRPYRRRSDLSIWVREPAVIDYVEARLARYRYVAIGEFHVYGSDADLPNVRRIVELARQNNMFLHAHGDTDAIERLFRQDPGARILWAHSGFIGPDDLRALLRRYPSLWCDLAFRNEHAIDDQLNPSWRALFVEFPDRFVLGTDTFTPERWYYIAENARQARAWLTQLPKPIAERIAWRNAEALVSSAGSR